MSPSRTLRSIKFFTFLSVAILAVSSVALAAPKSLQSVNSDTLPITVPDAFPPSMQSTVQIMVEMADAPAAVPYAAALKEAQAQADAARNYALAHPNLKTSQALLKSKPQSVQISSVAASQVKSAVQQIDQAQLAILPALTGGNVGGQVMYRVQRAYNGIALVVSPDKIAAITAMPGVKAVHPLHPKFATAAFSDIDFLNTRPAWTSGPFGTHGENIKVADIDTGLDYIHRDFGGSGSAADYGSINDTSPVPNADYPSQKVPGGTDLVGDAYNASGSGAQLIPHPDNNPLDSAGHGTATASLIAGYGVTNGGFTYAGSYDATNPDMSTLKIAPGFAPNAKLYPVRVFGSAGSTNVVVEAIEWAMDPNGDGNFSDHMDVINMSLGSNEGFADDPDDIAASNASSIGVLVCSAAGNAGDSYYIHSSPAAAPGTLSCAATFNDQAGYIYDSNVTSNTAGGGGVGTKYFSIKGSASAPIPGGGLTGNVVYAVPNDANTNGGAAGGPGLSNAAQVSGNICLVNRGTTTFTDKVTKCLNAGATAVIMVNFTDNPNAFVPILASTAGQPTGIDVMISHNDRNTINAAAGGFDATTGIPVNPVNVTLNNDNGSVVIPALAAPDTVASYSSRGPRLPDSAIKPDISSPAEVTGVAQSAAEQAVTAFSGIGVENFNGTSSATPHIAGMMALLRQLHPTWTVQELNALACNNANHDLFTTTAHTTQFGVGRVGAGRNDVGVAAQASVVAYNGTDPNLVGVSFGVVETPVDSSSTLTKNITVTNKGSTNVTYNTSIQNDPAVAGAAFTLGSASFTVNAGTTMTIPVTFTATGNLLKHAREASVSGTQTNPRQWLTEAAGYAVFTPTDSSPTLRVALYSAPKPVSSMHATITGVVPTAPNTGSFSINLSGAPVNTGASLGSGFDILSLVKAFELQYINPAAGLSSAPTDRNVIKYVGVTSDYPTRGPTTTRIVFGLEGFGDAPEQNYGSSDKEIYIDTGDGAGGPPDGNPDFAVYLSNNGTGQENVFLPVIVKLNAGTAASAGFFTNGLNSSVADTNAYNNSCVTIPIPASGLVDTNAGATPPYTYPALGTAGHTQFLYQVFTFDRNGNEVDETPVLSYDLANPGLEVENSGAVAGVQSVFSSASAFVENFMYKDLPTNFIPVNYNGTNFQTNGSLGVLLFHMHNGDGNRSDVVAFRKPTIRGFSPTSGKVGAQITITGSNFGPGTSVKFFNNKTATVNVITSNTLVATVPAGAVSGPIRVLNAAGFSVKGGFTVLP